MYVVQCTDLFGLCESRAKANNCSARNYLRPSRNPKKKCPKSGGASGLEKKKCKISLFSGNSSSSTADSNIIVLQEKKGTIMLPYVHWILLLLCFFNRFAGKRRELLGEFLAIIIRIRSDYSQVSIYSYRLWLLFSNCFYMLMRIKILNLWTLSRREKKANPR